MYRTNTPFLSFFSAHLSLSISIWERRRGGVSSIFSFIKVLISLLLTRLALYPLRACSSSCFFFFYNRLCLLRYIFLYLPNFIHIMRQELVLDLHLKAQRKKGKPEKLADMLKLSIFEYIFSLNFSNRFY